MILIHFNCGSLRRHEQLIQIVQKGSEKNIMSVSYTHLTLPTKASV